MTSHPVSIGAGTTKLSGRFLSAMNGQPKALLVALHGGGNTLARAFYMKRLAFVEECILYRLNRASV